MSNLGTYPGTGADGWKYYDTDLKGSNASGNPTQPGLGDSTFYGRYYRNRSGFVICQVYFKFGSTFTAGNPQNYVVKLPFPGNRWTSALSNATADIPIGAGYVYETNDQTTASTTIAAGSNAVNTSTFLGAGTLNVASTTGFTSNGTITVATGGTPAVIRYSGITSTTFTGCNTNSGGGVMSTSGSVTGTTGINKTLPLIPTLADPLPPYNLHTQEDYWAHIFIQHSKNTGAGTIAQGATTQTITHNLGLTPIASDIFITPTGNPTTNPQNVSVQNITSTSFDVVSAVSLTTGTLPFEWKAMVEPNSSLNFPQLVNFGRPWAMGPGTVISLKMEYETRF